MIEEYVNYNIVRKGQTQDSKRKKFLLRYNINNKAEFDWTIKKRCYSRCYKKFIELKLINIEINKYCV